jgi:2-C-methyl-D-erythritol 4-phosphate cytidylyltransferase/2-C-methyl-D-erythritol 2,4-cyclodiphosphate synthase
LTGVDAIVVAAGSSQRMGGDDKLAQTIGGRPLLAHTLTALSGADTIESMIVVAAPERCAALEAADWLPAVVRAVVPGGPRRQDSVRLGFEALERIVPDPAGERVVLVHDGARPLVSADLVRRVSEAAAAHGAAIPAVPLAETVKRVADGRVVETVDRGPLVAAQTPQGARRGILRSALATVGTEGTWTDEAALLEACRIAVHVLPGDPTNLKVTVPADLRRAAHALTDETTARRTGVGQDSHSFGPGEPLRLGGVTIPRAPRLHGHSDGDVALHALADALLGAASLGDLGRLFPPDARTPAGIASDELLGEVVGRLHAAGWRASTVDLTIIGARPRLGAHLESMVGAIANLLRLEPGSVNVKASTGNLEGVEGAGRAISAIAVATIEPDR